MKIAITAGGNDWQEKLDSRFGRTKGFFIIDTDSGDSNFVDNMDNHDAQHGAGTSAAQSLAQHQIHAVISGRVGPKAASVLKSAGIKMFNADELNSIKEAYHLYKDGKLKEQNIE